MGLNAVTVRLMLGNLIKNQPDKPVDKDNPNPPEPPFPFGYEKVKEQIDFMLNAREQGVNSDWSRFAENLYFKTIN